MNRKEIFEDLQEIFRTVFEDSQLELSESLTAKDVANWDSLTHMTLIYATEAHFGIEILFESVLAMENAGDLIQNIEMLGTKHP